MKSLDLESLLKETLSQYLDRSDGLTPPNLQESIRYSLLAPGKRIRPRLLMTCGEMLGLQEPQLIPAALALEMIHCYTLIHDDLPCMDDDDFRRGLPSNHKRFGEGVALLAGNSLMALALDLILDSPVDSLRLKAGVKRLVWASGPRGVIGGQAAESLLGSHSNLTELQQMHRQKTGALFAAALMIPKDFAGIADDTAAGKAILSFADELGLAFQIADDLEDLAEAEKSFQPEPTSILFFMTAKEATDRTLEKLRESSKALHLVWGDRSFPLIEIADEVGLKIRTALQLSLREN